MFVRVRGWNRVIAFFLGLFLRRFVFIESLEFQRKLLIIFGGDERTLSLVEIGRSLIIICSLIGGNGVMIDSRVIIGSDICQFGGRLDGIS